MTKIEWTEATWNPIVGCSVVSPGCTNCYAMRMAHRLAANPATPHYAGTVQASKAGPVWTGKVALAPDAVLTAPMKRRKPTMYFVNSMGDLFHEDVPDGWIDRVFAVMALAPQHTFQVLTKRADRMRAYLGGNRFTDSHATERIGYAAMTLVDEATGGDETNAPPWPVNYMAISSLLHGPTPNVSGVLWPRPEVWPLRNVWLGVSAEDQTRADERIPDLLVTPAAIRFVSAEPLLGPVDLRALTTAAETTRPYRALVDALDGTCQSLDHASIDWFKLPSRLDWVICGGESGPGARSMHSDWARSIRDQCAAAGVPFFFKQWGEWLPEDHVEDADPPDGIFNRCSTKIENEHRWYGVGKRAAGRLLDGRVWDEMPERNSHDQD